MKVKNACIKSQRAVIKMSAYEKEFNMQMLSLIVQTRARKNGIAVKMNLFGIINKIIHTKLFSMAFDSAIFIKVVTSQICAEY